MKAGFEERAIESDKEWTLRELRERNAGDNTPIRVHHIVSPEGLKQAKIAESVKTLIRCDPDLNWSPPTGMIVESRASDALAKLIQPLIACDFDVLTQRLVCRSAVAATLLAIDDACADTDETLVLTHDVAQSIAQTLSTPDLVPDSLVPGAKLTGTCDIVGSITGPVTVEVVMRKKMVRGTGPGSCVPLLLSVRSITFSGKLALDFNLAALRVSASGEKTFADTLYSQPVGQVAFVVGGIPVVVDLGVAIRAGLNAAITGEAKLALNAGATLPVELRYTWTPNRDPKTQSNWTGSTHVGHPSLRSPTLTDVVGGGDGVVVSGEGMIEPWIGVLFRVGLYTAAVDNVSLGLSPSVKMRLWGTLPGVSACDLDGDGALDRVEGTLLDADIALRVQGGIDADWVQTLSNFTPLTNPLFVSLKELSFHGSFLDLQALRTGEPSSVLTPLLVPSAAVVAHMAPFEVRFRMNDCYPYTDEMSWLLEWGDGEFETISFAPNAWVSRVHRYAVPGRKTVQLTARKDSHGTAGGMLGRRIQRSATREVTVATQ